MKKITTFKSATGEAFDLVFTIISLASLERQIQQSIFSLVQSVASGAGATLDFTITALSIALDKDREYAIKVIETHCKAGGTVDEINGALLQAVIDTGLFTPGETQAQGETSEETAEK